jgi:hypothetical protein
MMFGLRFPSVIFNGGREGEGEGGGGWERGGREMETERGPWRKKEGGQETETGGQGGQEVRSGVVQLPLDMNTSCAPSG